MKTNSIYFFLVFFCCLHSAIAQERFTISGYVKDAASGEDLIGATVTIKEIPGTGSATNAYGFYSLSQVPGHYEITAQYMGYTAQKQKIDLSKSITINFQLAEEVSELSEVVVSAIRKDENITKTQMGNQKLDSKDLKNIPVLLGEKRHFKVDSIVAWH